jgi:purine-nucleoside phosphorylase
VLAFLGRVHLYEGATFDEVTFPIRLLASVGARAVVVTQAAGAASPWLSVPGLMLIRDQVNLTGRSFPAEAAPGSLYSRRLRSLTRRAAFEQGLALPEGVLAGFLGPSYETAAEVRMARRAGAHALTMSTVPEIVAARSRGLEVVGLSVITNRAPHSGGEIQHEAVVENASAGATTLRPLLGTLIPRLGS